MGGSLIPVSDEQAKAIQEALKLLHGLGTFFSKALGGTPEDIVAVLGGDWIRVKRAENMVKMLRRAESRLNSEQINIEAAPLKLAIPILRDAADESRDELQELWAELLAAAVDPNRVKDMRSAYVDIAKSLEIDDLSVLRHFAKKTQITAGERSAMSGSLGLTLDRGNVSIDHLKQLGLVFDPNGLILVITSLGKEFMRLVTSTPSHRPK
jgi:hypothetical protein